MNIIITSPIHFGKTTVAEKLVKKLKENNTVVGGILCKGEDIQDILTGETHKFLHKEKIHDSQNIGPYYIKNSAIKFGEKAISNAIDSNAYAVIDEYGLLELRGQGFNKVTETSLKSNKCIILMKKMNLDTFLKKFNQYEFKVFELTKENRDNLHEEVFGFISEN